jgi:TetR/AcrR family fatty acid metabolism transcriptional regulator
MTDRSVISGQERKVVSNRGPDRQARRQAILQAARQVFARKGFEPATLEAVAREAGLAKGTLYLYFKNKEDLYYHTVLHLLDSLQSNMQARVEQSAGALQKLRAIALGQLEYFVRHQDTLQLFSPFSNPDLARLHKRLVAPVMERWAGYGQRVTALVEEGQREGTLRQDLEPRQIALAFLGILSQASQSLVRIGPASALKAGPHETPERMADTVLRILVEGVMRR